MNKIQNFQTFSQLKTQLKEQAAKKEMATKREAAVTEYNELLSKYNVSKITELSEKDRATFLAELTKEGNAFGAARAKAIAKGDKEFEVDGDTVPVKDVDKEDEDNAEEFVDESVVTEAFTLQHGGKEFKQMDNRVNASDRMLFAKTFWKIARSLGIGNDWDYDEIWEYARTFMKGATYRELLKTESVDLADESIVTEGKDDYVARYSGTNITLKKGYKHHTEEELQKLYNKIGELVKDDLKVKDVTIVFESVVNESELSLKSNLKLYKKVEDKLKGQKYNKDAEYHLTLLKAMNPKKLSASDLDTLSDFDDLYESVIDESTLSSDELGEFYTKAINFVDKFKKGGNQKLRDAIGEDLFFNRGKEWFFNAWNVKKLTSSEVSALLKKLETNESVVTEAVSSKDEKSIEDFIKSAIGKKVKLTTKEFDGESDVEDKFTKASWGNNVYKVDYMSIDFDQELDAIKRGSGKILKLDKNTFKWNVDGPKGTDITIEIK